MWLQVISLRYFCLDLAIAYGCDVSFSGFKQTNKAV